MSSSPHPAVGRRRRPSRLAAALLPFPLLAAPLAPLAAQARAAATAVAFERALPDDRAPSGRAVVGAAAPRRAGVSTVLHGVGGAAVGSFVGYLVSQVLVSNWDQSSGDRPNRGPYVIGGAVLGGLTGVAVDLWGRPRRGADDDGARVPVVAARDRANLLTIGEIQSAGARNLYELVRARRNQWLVPRGVNALGEGASTAHDPSGRGGIVVVPGRDLVMVYVDGVRFGGVEKLAELLPANAAQLEFLDAGQATLRYGTGNAHGVILVTTRRPPAPSGPPEA